MTLPSSTLLTNILINSSQDYTVTGFTYNTCYDTPTSVNSFLINNTAQTGVTHYATFTISGGSATLTLHFTNTTYFNSGGTYAAQVNMAFMLDTVIFQNSFNFSVIPYQLQITNVTSPTEGTVFNQNKTFQVAFTVVGSYPPSSYQAQINILNSYTNQTFTLVENGTTFPISIIHNFTTSQSHVLVNASIHPITDLTTYPSDQVLTPNLTLVGKCPKDVEFIELHTGLCPICHEFCKECIGPNKDECISCNGGLVLKGTPHGFCISSEALVALQVGSVSSKAVAGAAASVAVVSSGAGVVASASGASSSGGSPQLFWILLNNYQILEVFALSNIDLHSSIIELIESFSYATLSFDFIKIDWLDKQKTYFQEQMSKTQNLKVEYKGGIPIKVDPISVNKPNLARIGLGGSFVLSYSNFFAMIAIAVLINMVVSLCCRVSRKQILSEKQSFCVKLKLQVRMYFKYDTYLRFMLEGFLFMNVMALLEISYMDLFNSNWFSLISNLSAVLTLTMNVALFCFTVMHYCLYLNYPDLEDEFTSCRALYEGLKPNRKSRLYMSQFLFRRLALALVFVFSTSPIAQVSTFIALQVFGIGFIIVIFPFETRQDNLLELLNEMAILFCLVVLSTLVNNTTKATTKAMIFIGGLNVHSLLLGIVICAETLISICKGIFKACQKARPVKAPQERIPSIFSGIQSEDAIVAHPYILVHEDQYFDPIDLLTSEMAYDIELFANPAWELNESEAVPVTTIPLAASVGPETGTSASPQVGVSYSNAEVNTESWEYDALTLALLMISNTQKLPFRYFILLIKLAQLLGAAYSVALRVFTIFSILKSAILNITRADQVLAAVGDPGLVVVQPRSIWVGEATISAYGVVV